MLDHFIKKLYQTFYRRFIIWAVAILMVPLLFGGTNLHAKSMAFSEDQIKAVYLYNLTSFVDWPDEVFDSADAPLRIAVSGDERVGPFVEFIHKVIAGENVGERAIVIDRLPISADPSGYQILFITGYSEIQASHLIKAARDKPILTVGDFDGFCQRGGMINLLRSGNRIGLEVNIGAAREANLRVSSMLLRIATIIHGNDRNGGD